MSDNTIAGFGKDPLTASHGDALADQSFQSLKSKEIRDSMSPTEMKFQSMALNHPTTTGWNVQSSKEVSPDGRGFRTESVATTDGVENVNGGTAEFKGRNEQRSSAHHQGDDKNFVKKAMESSNSHLQEKVVVGDENSGRTEIRSSSTKSTSSSQVFQSSSNVEYDDRAPIAQHPHHQPYLMDHPHRHNQQQQEEQRIQEEHRLQEQQFRQQHQQHVNQQQERRTSEQLSTTRQNTEQKVQTQETHEQNKRYVDMDKASPEYQQHVQFLMQQPGEVISQNVEYPKPNVKMITTVKRLPDGTIVRNKRYETEELTPTPNPSLRQTTTSTNQTNQRRDSQQQTKNYQPDLTPSGRNPRRPNEDLVDNRDTTRYVQDTQSDDVETKFSSVKKSSRKFSTESTSETIQESSHPETSRIKTVTSDFSTHGFPSVKSTKPTQEYPSDRPQGGSRPTQGYPSQPSAAVVPHFTDDVHNISERRIPTKDGELIIVSSEKQRNYKHQTNSERIVETDHQITDQDFSTHGFPSVREPVSQPKNFPEQRQVQPTPGTRVVTTTLTPNDDSVVVSSQKLQTVKNSSNTERIIEHEVVRDDQGFPRIQPNTDHNIYNYTVTTPGDQYPGNDFPGSTRKTPSDGYSTQGFPSVRSPNKTTPYDQGFPSTRDANKPNSVGGTPTKTQPRATSPNKSRAPNTTRDTTERVIRKEKEVDSAHRAFAASLRSSSPHESHATDSHGRHTPSRSSVSSTKTFRRDGREGSHDSAPSETSRFSNTTVTRQTPPRTVGGKTTVTRVVTTKTSPGSNENITITSPRATKSPSPGKTVTTTTTTKTITSKTPSSPTKEVPKSTEKSPLKQLSSPQSSPAPSSRTSTLSYKNRKPDDNDDDDTDDQPEEVKPTQPARSSPLSPTRSRTPNKQQPTNDEERRTVNRETTFEKIETLPQDRKPSYDQSTIEWVVVDDVDIEKDEDDDDEDYEDVDFGLNIKRTTKKLITHEKEVPLVPRRGPKPTTDKPLTNRPEINKPQGSPSKTSPQSRPQKPLTDSKTPLPRKSQPQTPNIQNQPKVISKSPNKEVLPSTTPNQRKPQAKTIIEKTEEIIKEKTTKVINDKKMPLKETPKRRDISPENKPTRGAIHVNRKPKEPESYQKRLPEREAPKQPKETESYPKRAPNQRSISPENRPKQRFVEEVTTVETTQTLYPEQTYPQETDEDEPTQEFVTKPNYPKKDTPQKGPKSLNKVTPLTTKSPISQAPIPNQRKPKQNKPVDDLSFRKTLRTTEVLTTEMIDDEEFPEEDIYNKGSRPKGGQPKEPTSDFENPSEPEEDDETFTETRKHVIKSSQNRIVSEKNIQDSRPQKGPKTGPKHPKQNLPKGQPKEPTSDFENPSEPEEDDETFTETRKHVIKSSQNLIVSEKNIQDLRPQKGPKTGPKYPKQNLPKGQPKEPTSDFENPSEPEEDTETFTDTRKHVIKSTQNLIVSEKNVQELEPQKGPKTGPKYPKQNLPNEEQTIRETTTTTLDYEEFPDEESPNEKVTRPERKPKNDRKSPGETNETFTATSEFLIKSSQKQPKGPKYPNKEKPEEPYKKEVSPSRTPKKPDHKPSTVDQTLRKTLKTTEVTKETTTKTVDDKETPENIKPHHKPQQPKDQFTTSEDDETCTETSEIFINSSQNRVISEKQIKEITESYITEPLYPDKKVPDSKKPQKGPRYPNNDTGLPTYDETFKKSLRTTEILKETTKTTVEDEELPKEDTPYEKSQKPETDEDEEEPVCRLPMLKKGPKDSPKYPSDKDTPTYGTTPLQPFEDEKPKYGSVTKEPIEKAPKPLKAPRESPKYPSNKDTPTYGTTPLQPFEDEKPKYGHITKEPIQKAPRESPKYPSDKDFPTSGTTPLQHFEEETLIEINKYTAPKDIQPLTKEPIQKKPEDEKPQFTTTYEETIETIQNQNYPQTKEKFPETPKLIQTITETTTDHEILEPNNEKPIKPKPTTSYRETSTTVTEEENWLPKKTPKITSNINETFIETERVRTETPDGSFISKTSELSEPLSPTFKKKGAGRRDTFEDRCRQILGMETYGDTPGTFKNQPIQETKETTEEIKKETTTNKEEFENTTVFQIKIEDCDDDDDESDEPMSINSVKLQKKIPNTEPKRNEPFREEPSEPSPLKEEPKKKPSQPLEPKEKPLEEPKKTPSQPFGTRGKPLEEPKKKPLQPEGSKRKPATKDDTDLETITNTTVFTKTPRNLSPESRRKPLRDAETVHTITETTVYRKSPKTKPLDDTDDVSDQETYISSSHITDNLEQIEVVNTQNKISEMKITRSVSPTKKTSPQRSESPTKKTSPLRSESPTKETKNLASPKRKPSRESVEPKPTKSSPKNQKPKPDTESTTTTTTIKDRLRSSTRKTKSPSKHDQVDGSESSPEPSPTRISERRRSSNISVNTEIIIEHTEVATPEKPKKSPGPKRPQDSVVRDIIDSTVLPDKLTRKMLVTERKESAPVHRVTHKDKDSKMSRSTSENLIKVKKPESHNLSPKTTPTPRDHRRPNKCFATKSINLTPTDRLVNSEDMENVIIDIQHAKSSREPSPDKIVPTPVPAHFDTGKPRYPDVVQEPEDEQPRRKPQVKNIPIFEEEHNSYVGINITEVNIEKSRKTTMDSLDYDHEILNNPLIEAPPSLDYPSLDKPSDDECLLTVHEKVSKFQNIAEDVKKPKPSSPFNREFDETTQVPMDDECLLTVDAKVDKFLKTAENVIKTPTTPSVRVERIPYFEEDDEEFERNERIFSSIKLAPTAPQKSPDLVRNISRNISRQSEAEPCEDSHPNNDDDEDYTLETTANEDFVECLINNKKTTKEFVMTHQPQQPSAEKYHQMPYKRNNDRNDDDGDDEELIPHTATHTTRLEERRQKDILTRPSVFDNKNNNKKPNAVNTTTVTTTTTTKTPLKSTTTTRTTTTKSPIKDSEKLRPDIKSRTKPATTAEHKHSTTEQQHNIKTSTSAYTSKRRQSPQRTQYTDNDTEPDTDNELRAGSGSNNVETGVGIISKQTKVYKNNYTTTIGTSNSTTTDNFNKKSTHLVNTKPEKHIPVRLTPAKNLDENDLNTDEMIINIETTTTNTTNTSTKSSNINDSTKVVNGKINKEPKTNSLTTPHSTLNKKQPTPQHSSTTNSSSPLNSSPREHVTTKLIERSTLKHNLDTTTSKITANVESPETIEPVLEPSKRAPFTPKSTTMDTVAARRNIFENNQGGIVTPTRRTPTASPLPGRRPSYMDHTKSSLEHTRRDSLEFNKTHYSRKPSQTDDDNTSVDRHSLVKFNVPRNTTTTTTTTEDINIEEIFDLVILESLLETVTSYELRRRIRAQIRLIKKNQKNEVITPQVVTTKTSVSKPTTREETDNTTRKTKPLQTRDRSLSPIGKTTKQFLTKESETHSISRKQNIRREEVEHRQQSPTRPKSSPSSSPDRSDHGDSDYKRDQSPNTKSKPLRSYERSHSPQDSTKSKPLRSYERSHSPQEKPVCARNVAHNRPRDHDDVGDLELTAHTAKHTTIIEERRQKDILSRPSVFDNKKPNERSHSPQEKPVCARNKAHNRPRDHDDDDIDDLELTAHTAKHTTIIEERRQKDILSRPSVFDNKKPNERSRSPQEKPKCLRNVSHNRSHSPEMKETVREEYGSRSTTKKQYYYNDEEINEIKQETRKQSSGSPTRKSPSSHTSPERRDSSPESKKPLKTSQRSRSPPGKTPTQSRPYSRSPDSKTTSSVRKSSTTEQTSLKSSSTKPQQEKRVPMVNTPLKTKPEGNASTPLWADRRNLLKTPGSTTPKKPATSTLESRTGYTKTTKSTSSQRMTSSNKSSFIEDDCITSSYGIGPTDENGLPLFGIRALKAKKPTTEPCETTEEVTGYIVEEKSYSDNKTKPIVERKELIYSTNPEELEKIKQQVKGTSTIKSLKDAEVKEYRQTALISKANPKAIPALRSSPDDDFLDSTTKYVRRGSVKEMSEKFIHRESSSSITEKSNYPKAGLILRTNSRKNSRDNETDGENYDSYKTTRVQHTGALADSDDAEHEYEVEEIGSRHSGRLITESESEAESVQTQREFKKVSSSKSSSTRTFLNSQGEEKMITNVSDCLERMRNADNVIEDGDTTEDQEARALLNKFLGASIIMSGVETSIAPASNRQSKIVTTTTTNNRRGDINKVPKQEVKTTRITKTIKSGSSSSPVIQTTCDIEEIWDEEILKELLEQAKTYEERRKIRSRLRELMADREEKNKSQAGEKEVKPTPEVAKVEVEEEEESSASEYEEIIEEVTDYSESEAESDDKNTVDNKEAAKTITETKVTDEKVTENESKEELKVEESPKKTASSDSKKSDTSSSSSSDEETVKEETVANNDKDKLKEVDTKSEPKNDKVEEEVKVESKQESVDKTDSSEKGESIKPTSQPQQKSTTNSQKLKSVQSSSGSSSKTTTGKTSSETSSMHAPSYKKVSSAAPKTSQQNPIVTVQTAGRTDSSTVSNKSTLNSSSSSGSNKISSVVSNSNTVVVVGNNSPRQVDRLGVPQKEDSGTESGEDLRLIAAGLRDQLQIQSDSNIIEDVTCALSRLESSLKEGKDIAVDLEKRKALLALVARLQAGLTSPEKLAQIAAAMSELDGNEGLYGESSSPEADAHRSNRSRFAKRRSRIDRHTVGVSREELADARRYMEDMIMMGNISQSTTPEANNPNNTSPPQWYPIEKNASTGAMLTPPSPSAQLQRPKQFVPEANIVATNTNKLNVNNSNKRRPLSGDFSVSFEPQVTSYNRQEEVSQMTAASMRDISQSDTQTSPPDDTSKFARFSNKKHLMKRANTIDIAKTQKYNSEFDTDSDAEDKGPYLGLKRTVQVSVKKRAANVVPAFEPKTENDRKFLAFINKQSDKPGLGWTSSRSVSNWTNKFGSIKNTFEGGLVSKPPQVPHHHVAGPNKPHQSYKLFNQPVPNNSAAPFITTNQQIAQRLKQEAARQTEERRRKLEREHLEYERRERDQLERQRQQKERQERERLEREYFERQRREQDQIAAAQHANIRREQEQLAKAQRQQQQQQAANVSVPQPRPINEFKHAPQSVFRPIDNVDAPAKPIYKPIPQLPMHSNNWQSLTSGHRGLSTNNLTPTSPNNYGNTRPDNSFITSPTPSSRSPIGLPWASKPTVDSSGFKTKANRFEERSKYDNISSGGPFLQRHNSLRSANGNGQQLEEFRKRPSLPNTCDPYSVNQMPPQTQYQDPLAYLPPPQNISFTYSDLKPNRKNYQSYPCLPTAVSNNAVEPSFERSREDSLTDPNSVPLVLSANNPTYCPPSPQQQYLQQPPPLPRQFDIVSPLDSAPTSPSVMLQTDCTDDDIDSDNLLEYHAVSRVMRKPQSQTAVTVGRRTGHASDDELFGKNSRAARNLLSTMKNLGNPNGDRQQKPPAQKRPEQVTSPNQCLSPDGRSYQAPLVEPLFPEVTNFEPNRTPLYAGQQPPRPTFTPKYQVPRQNMYKSLDNLNRPQSSNQSGGYMAPMQPLENLNRPQTTNQSGGYIAPMQPLENLNRPQTTNQSAGYMAPMQPLESLNRPQPTNQSAGYMAPMQPLPQPTPSLKPYVSETQTSYVVTYPTEETDDEDFSRHSQNQKKMLPPSSLDLRRQRNISENSTGSSTTASVSYNHNLPSPNTSWTANPIMSDDYNNYQKLAEQNQTTPQRNQPQANVRSLNQSLAEQSYTYQPQSTMLTQNQMASPQQQTVSAQQKQVPTDYMRTSSYEAPAQRPTLPTMTSPQYPSTQMQQPPMQKFGPVQSPTMASPQLPIASMQSPSILQNIPTSPLYETQQQQLPNYVPTQQTPIQKPYAPTQQTPTQPERKLPTMTAQLPTAKAQQSPIPTATSYEAQPQKQQKPQKTAKAVPKKTAASGYEAQPQRQLQTNSAVQQPQISQNQRVSTQKQTTKTNYESQTQRQTTTMTSQQSQPPPQQQPLRTQKPPITQKPIDYQIKNTQQINKQISQTTTTQEKSIQKKSLASMRKAISEDHPNIREHIVINPQNSNISQEMISKLDQQRERVNNEIRRKSLGNALDNQMEHTELYTSSAPLDTPDIVKSSLPKDENQPILKKFGPPQRHHYIPNAYQSPGSNVAQSTTTIHTKNMEVSSNKTTIKTSQQQQQMLSIARPTVVETPATPQPDDDYIPRNIVFNNVHAFTSMSRRQDEDISYTQDQSQSRPNKLSKSDSWNQIIQLQNQSMPAPAPKFNQSPTNELRRTKSGHTLALPKMFEAAMAKADIGEKQKTVAAYFSGQKSPLQQELMMEQHTTKKSVINRTKTSEKVSASRKSLGSNLPISPGGLTRSATMPHIANLNLLDESNVEDAFEQLMLDQNQQKSSSSTTEKTETKAKDGAVVTTTTKVTTRTVTGSAPKPVSPFAKFKQLDRQNSQQSAKSPTTPPTPGGATSASPSSGNQPIFRFTDPALNARAATVKDQLLQWCQMKTQEYENIEITNFSTSWNNGLAFCALIHHFLPDAFDYSQLTPKNRRKNFDLAFTVADEKAGIAPLLDVEDMVVMQRPDWKCVFVYVQSIYRRFRNCQ